MVEYWYDAWGNHKAVNASGQGITSPTHIGNLNPFRCASIIMIPKLYCTS